MAGDSGDDGTVEGATGSNATGEDANLRERTLERVCAFRASLTVAFALSGMILVVSVLLVAVVDLPAGSQAIAVADVGISGTVALATGLVLRACNRRRRGER